MTEYKKEAPSDVDDSAAFTIENYLAFIINLSERHSDKYSSSNNKNEFKIIIDWARRAWDLVPEPKSSFDGLQEGKPGQISTSEGWMDEEEFKRRKSVMDHSEALRNKDAFHA